MQKHWFKKSWEDLTFRWTFLALLIFPLMWDAAITATDFYVWRRFIPHYWTTIIFWGVLVICCFIQFFVIKADEDIS